MVDTSMAVYGKTPAQTVKSGDGLNRRPTAGAEWTPVGEGGLRLGR